MEAIILAFVTGLTTGGLSCLAVQGGLLASSLAYQIEQDLGSRAGQAEKGKRQSKQAALRLNIALPILLFLAAKLAAYTLLGGLLGMLGSFLTFDPITRALLLLGIGIFMVGNGLRMLEVHPIFRYFAIEPPKFITRFIRRRSKDGTDLGTPLFLGALTVFIPCGVTQAMMAAALGTGSAALGAALLFAFTLGASPVFFLVAYLTTQLGARLEKFFMRFVAIVVLILGLVTFDNGLNLIGSPVSVSRTLQNLFPAAQSLPGGEAGEGPASNQIELSVENGGYSPTTLRAKAGEAVNLELVTENTYSCARDFVIPALRYYTLLPETGRVSVAIPAQAAGTVMQFTCSMGMYTGQIVFEN